MIGKPDLSSRSVIFHEKCEIAGDLGLFDYQVVARRYSEQEVIDGTAHRESYHAAHALAEKLELLLLQHVAKAVTEREIPLWAIVPARPVVGLFDSTGDISRAVMRNHLPPGIALGYSGRARYVPLEYRSEDVKACFQMFELFGSSYQQQQKERVLTVVESFVQDTNRYFQLLQKSLDDLRRQKATITAA